MGKWRILGAVVAAFAAAAACRLGIFASSSIYGFVNPNITTTVVIPLGALMVLGLGMVTLVTLKHRREVFSYFTLVAAAGITGAILGLMVMAFVLD